MRNVSRPAILLTAAVAAATLGAPAFASASTTKNVPTSLNARATKSVVAAHHTDTVNLTLRSRKVGVTGESSHFVVRMRRDGASMKWGTWAPATVTAGTKAGAYTTTVTMPTKIAKGKKEQFQVKFTGDAAKHLRSSRSQVFTVTAG